MIDRVVHHASVVNIKGKSYRLREAMADADDAAPDEKAPRGKGNGRKRR